MDTYHPAPRTMPHLPMQCLPGQVQIRADRTLGTAPNVGFVAFGAQRLPQSCPVCFGMRGSGDESPGWLIVGAPARSGIYQQYDGSKTIPIVFADPTGLGYVNQCRLEIQRRPEADTARHSMSEYLVNLLGHRLCHDFLPCGCLPCPAAAPSHSAFDRSIHLLRAIGCTKLKGMVRDAPLLRAPNILLSNASKGENAMIIVVEIASRAGTRACKEYDAPSYKRP